MYVIKNALRNVTRTKGRNILIFIIVFIIAISCCVALSIKQAAETAKTAGLENLSITAEISTNRENIMSQARESGGNMNEAFQGVSELSLSELQKYAESSNVKDFTWTTTSSFSAVDGGIEPIDNTGTKSDNNSNSSSSSNSGQQSGQMPGGTGGGQQAMTPPSGMGTQGDFSVIGYSSYSAMTDFINQTNSMKSGTMFDETSTDHNCIISSELAELNNLSVGSTITIANPNQTSETYTLTVCGIYNNGNSSSTSGSQMRGFSTSSDSSNQILMNTNALDSIVNDSTSVATTSTDSTTNKEQTTALRSQLSGTYYFADNQSYEAFQNNVKTMGLSDNYTVSSQDVNIYKQSLRPLENLSNFAGIFLIIILVVGGAVLVILNIFNIRERKYEIGVLTAIGMKKGKVLMQFVTEILVVTFAALIIGTTAGAAVSVPTTNALLGTQLASSSQQQDSLNQNFSGKGSQMMQGGSHSGTHNSQSSTSTITSVSSATNWTVILQLLVIGILLTVLSGIVGAACVMRYEPLKILSTRT